jgi:hypothetical protein
MAILSPEVYDDEEEIPFDCAKARSDWVSASGDSCLMVQLRGIWTD